MKERIQRSAARLLAFVLAAAALLSLSPALAASPDPVESSLCRLYVDGQARTSKPYYMGRTLMVPLKAVIGVAEGWHYSYDGGVSTFGPAKGQDFKVEVGAATFYYGGKEHRLDQPCVFADDRVYVPWQYLEFALGFKVTIATDGRIDVNTKTGTKPAVTPLSMTVNGKKISGTPYFDGGVLMVPLRPIVTALGYGYDYSNALGCSWFSAKGIDTHIYWGINSYPVDNRYVQLSRLPTLVDGRLYVPVEYITDALKCRVVKSGTVYKFTR